MKKPEPQITFDKGTARFILEALGCKIDKRGYITRRGKRVRTISNELIKLKEFGGVCKAKNNKWIFVKDNIFDMIELMDLEEQGKVPNKAISLKDGKEFYLDDERANKT